MESNYGNRGGAIFTRSSDINIKNVMFISNNASMGGAVCSENSFFDIEGSTAENNLA